jgi:hypothetical protein
MCNVGQKWIQRIIPTSRTTIMNTIAIYKNNLSQKRCHVVRCGLFLLKLLKYTLKSPVSIFLMLGGERRAPNQHPANLDIVKVLEEGSFLLPEISKLHSKLGRWSCKCNSAGCNCLGHIEIEGEGIGNWDRRIYVDPGPPAAVTFLRMHQQVYGAQ